MPIPFDAVIRVNMAWYSPKELRKNLGEINHDIFMDVPIGRTKPPMNQYNIKEISDILGYSSKIKYLGVSNVKSPLDIKPFLNLDCQVVPKIECIDGIKNSRDIISVLSYPKRFIMLDHEDLYYDLLKKDIEPTLLYTKYVSDLKNICCELNCVVLQTGGIVFCEIE